MTDPPNPLEPRVLELLRDDRPAPSDARERARARLAVAIPIFARGGGGGHAAGGGARGAVRASSGLLGSHGVALVAFALGGAAGAGMHAALTNPPAPRVVYIAPSATALPTAPPMASTPLPLAPTATSVPPTTESARSAIAPTPTSRSSQLDGERLRLDEVRAALVQGDANGALDRLRSSRREFPRGVLGEERDALTVEALVGAGRYDEARAAAVAFRERYPSSLFGGAVESAVRSIP